MFRIIDIIYAVIGNYLKFKLRRSSFLTNINIVEFIAYKRNMKLLQTVEAQDDHEQIMENET